MNARPVGSKSIVSGLTAALYLIISLMATAEVLAQSPSNPLDIALVPSKRVLFPDERQVVLMMEVNAINDARRHRAPVALALVIDTSGSMTGQKIQDARSAAHALVDRLAEGDMLSIISYASSAAMILPNYGIGRDRSMAHQAIEHIAATGSTCISCGLEQGYALLSDASMRFSRRVVLLSDGNANVGIIEPHSLRAYTSAALEQMGIPTSTIGLGYDYNEDLMVALANGGAGSYYFLPDSDAIATVLDREFAQLNTVVATNVVIELTPIDGVTLNPAAIPGMVRNGQQIILNLGQIPAGSQRQILVPVALPEGDLGDVVSYRVRYEDSEGQSHQMESQAALSRSSDRDEVEASQDTRVLARAAQIRTSQEVETALDTYRSGNVSGGIEQLRQTAGRLQVEAQTLNAPALAIDFANVEQLLNTLEDEEPAPSDERVDGLQRHNRARTTEMEQGAAPAEMYYDSMTY